MSRMDHDPAHEANHFAAILKSEQEGRLPTGTHAKLVAARADEKATQAKAKAAKDKAK